MSDVSAEPSTFKESERNTHFHTEHLAKDLKERSIRGGIVTLAAQVVKFVVTIGSTMVLARLLTPTDFGLVAMVAPIAGFVSLFKDLGLSMATVQRQEISHHQVSTLFWINVGVSLALMVVLMVVSPVVGWFYGDMRVMWITVASATTFLLGGLAAQHQALIKRQMRFMALMAVELGGLLIGVVVGIWTAWAGWSYWALVMMAIGTAVGHAVIAWILSGWRPGLPVKGSGVRPMLKFGGNLIGANVLWYLGVNIDRVLLGWSAGPVPVGLYSRAYGLLTMPLVHLNAPLAAVAVPAMSRAVVNPDKYRRAYLQVVERLALLTGPLIATLIVCSDWVIAIALGNQWIEAAEIFAVLGFAGFVLPIRNSTSWLFVSQDRMQEHLYFHLVDVILNVGSVAAGLPWGAEGVAYAVAIRAYVALPILFFMAGRNGPVNTASLYRALVLPGCVTVVVMLGMLMVKQLFLSDLYPILGLGAAMVFSVGITTGCLIASKAGRRILTETWSDMRALKKRSETR